MKLGDILNAANYSKQGIFDDDPWLEKKYPGYIVNKSMSQHLDTLMQANYMNRYWDLPNKMQFDYYRFATRKRKRFGKWMKASKVKDIELVKSYCGYSNEKAKDALKILSKEQLEEIRDIMQGIENPT